VIVKFNGQAVADGKDLSRIVASTPAGRTVTVAVMRDGKALEFQATIGEMEKEKASATANDSSRQSLGVSVQNLTPRIAGELGISGNDGVLVAGVEPGSAAAGAGIRTGDVIREVNRKAVRDVDDFIQKLEKVRGGDSVLLLIERERGTLFVPVPLR